MLRTLLESAPRRGRRPGGVAVSAIVHLALVAMAATATAREVARPPDERPREVVFLQPAPAAPRRVTTGPTPARAAARALPAAPAIPVPTVIPVGIPEPRDIPAIDSDRLVVGAGEFSGREVSGADREDGRGVAGEDTRAHWTGAEAALRLVRQPQEPHYPDVLRQAGVEGRVTVQFVVDTAGRVDRGSVRLLEAAHDLFAASATRALLTYRFQPALTAAGRRVPAAAVMSFEFRIRR